MNAADGEKHSTGKQEDPLAGADADDDMGEPSKGHPDVYCERDHLGNLQLVSFTLLLTLACVPLLHVCSLLEPLLFRPWRP